MSDFVTIHCYDEPHRMERDKAIKFYMEGAYACDGSEKARYSNILLGLLDGKKEVFDDLDEQEAYDDAHPENATKEYADYVKAVSEKAVKNTREQAEDLISVLPGGFKDALYRALWKEHVKEDVEAIVVQNENIPGEHLEEIIDNAAELYVYDGEYDCNLDYWANIDGVIDRASGRYEEREEKEEP